MSDLARKRQAAWDVFIQKRTQTEAQYNELIQKESNSPYQPMREYVSSLPKTLAEVIPSFYIPMEQQLTYPTQCEEEVAKYNQIVATVMRITEEMLEQAEQQNVQFMTEVRV